MNRLMNGQILLAKKKYIVKHDHVLLYIRYTVKNRRYPYHIIHNY